ncbi:MAG: hypothetical protein [Podoviridae sp. ctLUJ1]|nr:MAG: hypothetical protein [Podoviridae sp. ctLUJ1]
MAKKRTKKYNPKKHLNSEHNLEVVKFKEGFKRIGIACNLLDETKSGLFMEHGIPPMYKKDIMHMMFNCKHSWTIYAGVCIKESNGKNKLKSIDIGVSAPVVFKDITQCIQEAHRDFLYSFTNIANKIVGYGFIAFISDEPIEDEALMKGFEQIGGFDGEFVGYINEKGTIDFKHLASDLA